MPRNLAIKSEIIGKLGHPDEADELYQKSATIIDSLLKSVPTRNVERLLLAEMGEVYAGYFVSTCSRHDDDQALRILEEARGRIEAQALQHHEYIAPHAPTPAERRLTVLNIALLDTDNRARRQELTDRIYNAELMFNQQSLASATIEHPVSLSQLNSSLARDEVLIDYVLVRHFVEPENALGKLLDLYAERTFSVPGMEEHIPPFDQARCLSAAAWLEFALIPAVGYITH